MINYGDSVTFEIPPDPFAERLAKVIMESIDELAGEALNDS